MKYDNCNKKEIKLEESGLSFSQMKEKIQTEMSYTEKQNTYIVFTCPSCKRESKLSAKVFSERNELICRGCLQASSLSTHIQSCKDEWVNRWKTAISNKYGVDNASKSKEVQDRKKQTCLEKYGTEYAIAAKETREKIKSVFQEKYQGDSPFCSKEIQNKILENQKEKYNGKLRVQTEEFQEKRRATCLEKYDMPYAGGTEESIAKKHNTNLLRYGVEESWASTVSKQKRKQTMIDKYGVEFSMQDPEKRKEILQNRYDVTGHMYPTMKGYRYDDQNFDSSYELAYYISLRDNKKQFIYHPGTPLSYIGSDGLKHEYMPDFLIDGKFYEIKGDQFFNEKNEPWDPYRKQYWWEKYNSLIENGVVILRDNDLKPIFKYIKDNYGKTFLKECKSKKESV